MGLHASEWITVAYFAYLAGVAPVVPGIGRRQRRRAIGTAIAVVIAVPTIGVVPPNTAPGHGPKLVGEFTPRLGVALNLQYREEAVGEAA